VSAPARDRAGRLSQPRLSRVAQLGTVVTRLLMR
jgi:hypothetical protein